MSDYGYKEVGYSQRVVLENLVRRFESLEAYINKEVPEGRRRSLVITKLEEAAMWAAKAVSKPEPKREVTPLPRIPLVPIIPYQRLRTLQSQHHNCVNTSSVTFCPTPSSYR